MDNLEKNSGKEAGRQTMKHRRVITVCGFALSLVLCVFTLGGCVLWDMLFAEDPPQLIIKNEHYNNDITSVEFWDAGPLGRGEMSESELTQTPPLLKDTAIISYEGYRSWTLDTDKRYAVRINGSLYPVFLSDTEDTVYVFTGGSLSKRRYDYRSAVPLPGAKTRRIFIPS
ncbi:MAG: hypothetical protein LBK61_07640 [Spirochaetaceae bacterium]|jgi:hypothetical protein|nr:hypothetical protein [Spirochaetaceae bacterium]